jgi:hypothetical protein
VDLNALLYKNEVNLMQLNALLSNYYIGRNQALGHYYHQQSLSFQQYASMYNTVVSGCRLVASQCLHLLTSCCAVAWLNSATPTSNPTRSLE